MIRPKNAWSEARGDEEGGGIESLGATNARPQRWSKGEIFYYCLILMQKNQSGVFINKISWLTG